MSAAGTECSGKFGRWFGHGFREYLVKVTPPGASSVKLLAGAVNMVSWDLEDLIAAASTKEYTVRCCRCGLNAFQRLVTEEKEINDVI